MITSFHFTSVNTPPPTHSLDGVSARRSAEIAQLGERQTEVRLARSLERGSEGDLKVPCSIHGFGMTRLDSVGRSEYTTTPVV